MSEPAIFVFVQGNEKRYFYDQWAAPVLVRELLWGPVALQQWLTEDEELEDWTDEISGGAVVDLVTRDLIWYSDTSAYEIQRMQDVIARLIRAAWPGFNVRYATDGAIELAQAAGETDWDDDESEPMSRPESIDEAAMEDENEGLLAWITLIDESERVSHLHVTALPLDFIRGPQHFLSALQDEVGDEMPEEMVCQEGVWIDVPARRIGLWGVHETTKLLDDLKRNWQGWQVDWIEHGYEEQCAVSGPSGEPITDAQVLRLITSVLLSTDRFDLRQFYRMAGQQFKRSARRATGCLTTLLCMPLIIYALLSGNWKWPLILVTTVVVLVTLLFKSIEIAIKQKYSQSQLGDRGADRNPSRAPAAGPLGPDQRRAALDKTLRAAGLPSLAEINESPSML
ncbi:hypothetical protein [Stieleria varia]|uniref:Uncharacterized protein n=1 Tax=Stieleria varia TaxID=2528005 RepID=A0A5C6AZ51_9BACT|nr:hypothetical protein [Stieleria varia]TWU04701.1 hypothetical protein Pla52n_27430 [Stieleria varia]